MCTRRSAWGASRRRKLNILSACVTPSHEAIASANVQASGHRFLAFKLIVQIILRTATDMLVVFLMLCYLLVPFAVIATHLFGGRLHRCKVLSTDSPASYRRSKAFISVLRTSLTACDFQ
jgi:hypothetical protein